MIGIDGVFRVTNRALRHVAVHAVIAHDASRLLRFRTRRGLMAFQAALPIKFRSLSRLRFGVRIVAGATPQPLSTGALAQTLLQFLKMAVYAQGGGRIPCPHK